MFDTTIVFDAITSLDERLKTFNQLSMQAEKLGDKKLCEQLSHITAELDSSIKRLKSNFALA
jgi:hypothetical protein